MDLKVTTPAFGAWLARLLGLVSRRWNGTRAIPRVGPAEPATPVFLACATYSGNISSAMRFDSVWRRGADTNFGVAKFDAHLASCYSYRSRPDGSSPRGQCPIV